MERKIFDDEINEGIKRTIQKFEDGDISERYACLYDYFLDHEDIISQYSTFDFSNERCFDESALDCVSKRLLPKDCHTVFPVLIAFVILFHCCLAENNPNFRQNCELKQLVRWSKTGLSMMLVIF